MVIICCLSLLSLQVLAQAPVEPQAFYFEETTVNGETIVARVQVTADQKLNYENQKIAELQNELVSQGAIQQDQDPRAVAVWTYWWEQLKLWETYTEDELFRVDLAADIQTIDFTTQDGVKLSVENIYNTLVTQSEQINEEQHRENVQFLERLVVRENLRTAYEDWVRDKERSLLEFAQSWSKRMKGEILSVEGNIYLISSEPLEKIPRDAINIVTRKLTPYDLLNSDGSLKALPED